MIDRAGILKSRRTRHTKSPILSDVSYQQTPAYRAADAYAIPNPKSDPTRPQDSSEIGPTRGKKSGLVKLLAYAFFLRVIGMIVEFSASY